MLSLQAIDKNVTAEIDSQDKLASMKLKRLDSEFNPDYRWRSLAIGSIDRMPSFISIPQVDVDRDVDGERVKGKG